MKPKWRPVVHNKRYEVSSNGEVRNVKTGRCLKPRMVSGYYGVNLNKKLNLIHVLVAEAFISHRPHGYVCNHKDGIKTNNAYENLEWVTRSENTYHAIAMGLCHPKTYTNKVAYEDVVTIRELISMGVSISNISKKYGVSPYSVRGIKSGRLWSHV